MLSRNNAAVPSFSPLVLTPTRQQIAAATERWHAIRRECLEKTGKEYPNNSITRGEGYLAAIVAEDVIADTYHLTLNRNPPKSSSDPHCYWHYDLFSRWLFGRVEVKTKRRNVAPRSYYNGTVASYFTGQRCDFYMHASITYDFSRLWVCGLIPPDRFYALATPADKGDYDSESPPHHPFHFTAPCFNLRYDQMLVPPRLDGTFDDIPDIFLNQENLHELFS